MGRSVTAAQVAAIAAVRIAWTTYQAEASRERRADVPSLAAYWAAVAAVQATPPEDEE